MSLKTSERFFVNTITAAGVEWCQMVLGFLLFPLILVHLTRAEMGVWVLGSAFVSYLALLDLGVGTSTIKYTAEYASQGNKQRLNQIISFNLFFLITTALVGGAALVLVGTFLLPVFKVPLPIQGLSRTFFNFLAVNYMLTTAIHGLNSFLKGRQRYDLSSSVLLVNYLLVALLTFFVLWRGGGLIELGVANVVASAASAGLAVVFFGRCFDGWRLTLSWANRRFLREVFGVGGFISVVQITTTLLFRVDKFLLPILTSIEALPIYEAIWLVYQVVSRAPSALLEAIVPLASRLKSLGDEGGLRSLGLIGSRIFSLVFLAVVVPANILAHPFLDAWVGVEVGEYFVVLQLFLAHLLINFNHQVLAQILIGIRRINFFVLYYVPLLFLKTVMSVFLISKFQLTGAALASLGAFLLMEPVFLYHAFRRLPIGFGEYRRGVIWPVYLPAAALVWPLWLLTKCYNPTSLVTVLLVAGVWAVLYLGVYLLTPFGRKDLEVLWSISKGILKK